MTKLTDRQRQCLNFIQSHIAEHSMPPTRREIGAAMGITSTNGVTDHLTALQRKGYITLSDVRLSRGIKIADHRVVSDQNSRGVGDVEHDLFRAVVNNARNGCEATRLVLIELCREYLASNGK